MYCPNCGAEVDDNLKFCVFCGAKLTGNNESTPGDSLKENESIEKNLNVTQTGESAESGSFKRVDGSDDKEATDGSIVQTGDFRKSPVIRVNNSSLKAFRITLTVFALLFVIGSGYCFYKGYDVKNNYYYASYSTHNQNAYVGGDAYNYIINSNYFTGYNVAGIGCLICVVICCLGAVILYAKEKEFLYLEQIGKALGSD